MRICRMLALVLLCLLTGIGLAQATQGIDAKAIAADAQERFEACPRRETVTAFDRKHHKQAWVKGAWGPPTNVLVDIKANDSLRYPYVLTVEFNLRFVEGQDKPTKSEAESDTALGSTPGIFVDKYRNTFLVGKDGLHLRTTEFFDTGLNRATGGWKERQPWPNACWDQIH